MKNNFVVPDNTKRLKSKVVNKNDPYAFVEEFDLNAYDRKYADADRKAQEKNPFGKSKNVD